MGGVSKIIKKGSLAGSWGGLGGLWELSGPSCPPRSPPGNILAPILEVILASKYMKMEVVFFDVVFVVCFFFFDVFFSFLFLFFSFFLSCRLCIRFSFLCLFLYCLVLLSRDYFYFFIRFCFVFVEFS